MALLYVLIDWRIENEDDVPKVWYGTSLTGGISKEQCSPLKNYLYNIPGVPRHTYDSVPTNLSLNEFVSLFKTILGDRVEGIKISPDNGDSREIYAEEGGITRWHESTTMVWLIDTDFYECEKNRLGLNYIKSRW